MNMRQQIYENGYYEATTTEDYIYKFLCNLESYVDQLMDKRTQYEFCNEIQYLYNKVLGKSEADSIDLMNKRNSINYLLKENHIPYIVSLHCNRWIIIRSDAPDNFPDFHQVFCDDDYFDLFACNFVKLEKGDLYFEEDFSCGYDGLLKLNENENVKDFVNFHVNGFSKYLTEYFYEYLGKEFSKGFIKNLSSDLAESFYSDIIFCIVYGDKIKEVNAKFGALTKDEIREYIQSSGSNDFN